MKVLAILSSYRANHTIDQAADAILSAAHVAGAKVERVQLRDLHIDFCNNCRSCMQQEGEGPGECFLKDDMELLVAKIDAADRLVLASPVNCGTVNALYKRFMERSVVFGYWPWGKAAPVLRRKGALKKAVLLTSSAAPSLLTRFASDVLKRLKESARLLGAKPIASLVVGLSAKEPRQALPPNMRAKAQRLGQQLVT